MADMTDKQISDIAELQARKYFDHYLKEIHPKLMLEHFNSCGHGKLLNRVRWIGVGIIIALAPGTGLSVFSIIQKILVG